MVTLDRSVSKWYQIASWEENTLDNEMDEGIPQKMTRALRYSIYMYNEGI